MYNPLAVLIPIEIGTANARTGLRTEWRKNDKGKLRGVAFRERNKERHAVRYVGERSVGSRQAEYRRYANAYAERYNEQIGSVGNSVDGAGSVGNDETGVLIPLPSDWPRVDRIS